MNRLEYPLAFATRVVQEAADMLSSAEASEQAQAQADVLQHLEFELSHEPAVSDGGKWVFHVDESIVSIALLDSVEGPVVGAVGRPSTNEVLAGAMDAGAFQHLGDASPSPAPQCGMASMYHNIIHVPHDKCPELEEALDALHEKMPVNVTRVPCCCCCEGLFEVVSGRADVHLSPPEHCYLGQQTTPVAVLCAFDVLLRESGGYMSDVFGNEIDLAASIRTGEHTAGVLASDAASHPFMLNAIRTPFTADRLLLPRLAEKLRSDASGFSVVYENDNGGESIVLDEGRAGDASWAYDEINGVDLRFDGLDEHY